ncbi:hypothetical protein SEVIR_4G122600v4 [Setaria viridis]|uniref:Uncharacterized protein n=1 Tax=Setaria viridis TaxID=4556 RepID=A0A4U6UXP4_SETVI|nr:hypothetical protein SEVIR_4G122600v2 [Setaria viridis]
MSLLTSHPIRVISDLINTSYCGRRCQIGGGKGEEGARAGGEKAKEEEGERREEEAPRPGRSSLRHHPRPRPGSATPPHAAPSRRPFRAASEFRHLLLCFYSSLPQIRFLGPFLIATAAPPLLLSGASRPGSRRPSTLPRPCLTICPRGGILVLARGAPLPCHGSVSPFAPGAA